MLHSFYPPFYTSPSLHQCYVQFYGYFSSYTERTEVKQGSEVINGNRTQDLWHRRSGTNQHELG